MRLYGVESHASMDMARDPVLRQHLVELIARYRLDVAIETGTFLGLGSTRFIADAFLQVAPPKRLVTVEVNFANWCRAKANLRAYPFIDCRWGLSVALDRALEFLQHDEMLLNHQRYPDIYIDNISDPVAAYSRELRGQAEELERMPLAGRSSDVAFNGKDYLFDGEDLLSRLLEPIQEVVESEESVVIPCVAPEWPLRGARCGSRNTAALPSVADCAIRVI